MPVGGAVAAGAPAAPAAGAAAPVEEKKGELNSWSLILIRVKVFDDNKWMISISTEEKKPAKEESESEDDDMGFGLFD